MHYNLEIHIQGDVLIVTAKGNRSLQTIMAMSKEILAACVRDGKKKVICDVRELKGRLSTLEAFDVPDKYFPKIRDKSVITHSAIVDLKEYEKSYKFFEDVAVNRGFVLRIFSNIDEAIEWIGE